MHTSGPQSCLSGIRILDLTQFEAGPACTEVLAWLGATVVKVENPSGDPGRKLGSTPSREGSWFNLFNANKQSLAIDLKRPAGLELLKEMARQADVFVENLAPGAIERLGLGPDVVRAINPSIVYAQLKGFGVGSPYERSLSFDPIGQASGGVMSVTGERDGMPMKPGTTLGDTGTGMLLATSILAALYRRVHTGQGELLQASMQDAMLQYIRGAFADPIDKGVPEMRNGVPGTNLVNMPIGLYPCKGGGPNDYICIYPSRVNPEHWDRLLKAIGRPELIGDERYSTVEARVANKADVNAMLEAWTTRHEKREAMRLIGEAGIPASAVFDSLELLNDPSMAARGIMQTVEHPRLGTIKMPTWPVVFGGETASVEPAPALGEHSGDVLSSWLGLDATEIERLRGERVI